MRALIQGDMKWVLFAHPRRDDVHLRRRSTTYLRASGRTQDGINQEKKPDDKG